MIGLKRFNVVSDVQCVPAETYTNLLRAEAKVIATRSGVTGLEAFSHHYVPSFLKKYIDEIIELYEALKLSDAVC